MVLLEANLVPGAANRMLARLGATAAVSFEETAKALPRDRAVHTGNPLRAAVLGKRRDPACFGLEGSGPVLAVVGGSLGARGLNRRVVDALPLLAAEGVRLLWVAGEGDAIAVELRELYMRLETGQIAEAEFDAREGVLLDRLDAIRKRGIDADGEDGDEEAEDAGEDQVQA